MWTLEKINTILKENPINTNGSFSSYRYSKIKKYDDGDISYRIIFPLWSNNDQAQKDIFSLMNKILIIGDVSIYSERCGLKVYFHNHYCDPD